MKFKTYLKTAFIICIILGIFCLMTRLHLYTTYKGDIMNIMRQPRSNTADMNSSPGKPTHRIENRKQPTIQYANLSRKDTRNNKRINKLPATHINSAKTQIKRRNTFKHKNATFDLPKLSDEVYAVKNLEKLRLPQTDEKSPTFVLLVTYARSGSTWLGSITSQAEKSMYVFEPLYRLVVQGYYKKNEVCYSNNVCRAPTQLTLTQEFAITTFYRLFTCQVTKLHLDAVVVLVRNLRSEPMKKDLDKCLRINQSYAKCLQQLEETCLRTEHRILKTIRISLELVQIMLDLWPNLKIIYLIRDPRGITNSRQHSTSGFKMSRDIVSHSQALCSQMLNDSEYARNTSEAFPDRFKIVFYEALAERPFEGAKYVFNFMGSNLTDDILDWVYSSSHANVTQQQYFGTKRSNSTQSAHKWRNELNLSSVKIIDSACKMVYERLGFLSLNSSEKLNSSDIPSRIKPPYIDGFV